ncbi:hypothetical protein LPB72_15990 [Hydrogenophaga crassostreae]|uniref:DUF3455 domain-containing protein n=1 Tax=Hydrogenophaga crassostreae TaxID=1763535 RepID=A0A167H745_9BURK|nr:DUF3455 domain-containing protein [Hydrogenophaga crassostreae]AOW12547.1 hypothetical protein LPB072_06505 [Hydrogenophaga crassostreae]OAD40416.1 hypothetical protein LPB72_15990 [Hydrogenophaga crassostreae]
MFFKSALTAAAASVTLMACAAGSGNTKVFSQDKLPEAVKVPAGHKVAMETVGVGEITYQCRADKDMADKYAWVFAGPDAKLLDRSGKQVGKYYGPPATWEAMDGSKFDGKQLAVAPGGDGNIPFQLVQANPAMGAGAMTGVTYVQRSATKGGVAPKSDCGAANVDAKLIVNYQADYVFYKAS